MVYWSREQWYDDEFDRTQRRSFRSRRNQHENLDFESQDRWGEYRTTTYSNYYDDRNLDDFVVQITHFPWDSDDATEIKDIIDVLCNKKFVFPKSIKIITDNETGKPKFGIISFNSLYELNEVLQEGILDRCNCQKIRTKRTTPHKNQNIGNLIYIKKLRKVLQTFEKVIYDGFETEDKLRNMLIKAKEKSFNKVLYDALDRGNLLLEIPAEEFRAMDESESRENEMREKINFLETRNSELEQLKDGLIRENERLLQERSDLRDSKEVLQNEMELLQNEMDSMTRETSQFLLEHFKLEDQKKALGRRYEGLKLRLKETDSYNAELEKMNEKLDLQNESFTHVFKLPDNKNFKAKILRKHKYLQPADQIVISDDDTVRKKIKIGNKY